LVEVLGHYSNQARPVAVVAEVAAAPKVGVRSEPKTRQYTRLSEAQVAEMVARYAAGETAGRLAVAFGIHRHRVMRLVKAHGVVPRSRKLSDEDVLEAASFRAQGWTLVRIGKHFGVDGATIRRALIAAESSAGQN
jgi:hypothetical protein